MSLKTILIIGSEGFIGSHLVGFYIRSGWDVIGMDLAESSKHDIQYQQFVDHDEAFEGIIQHFAFERCVDAAGNGDVNFSVTHPYEDFKANTLLTIKLLEALRKHAPQCKYIHISSAAVYGNPAKLPITEQDEINPVSPYGWHKFLAEQSCIEYNKTYGLLCAIIRPFSVFGPGLRKQLLWDVYKRSHDMNGPLELWGTGAETRDYIFIDDLIHSIDIIFNHSQMNASIYNIASGEMTSISDIVTKLLLALNRPNPIFFNGNILKGNPINWKADISKLKSLSYAPTVNLEDGINKLAEWMKQLDQ